MLVFANYVNFSKYNTEIVSLLLTLNLGKTPQQSTVRLVGNADLAMSEAIFEIR